MKRIVTIIVLLFISHVANAHYVWLEKGENNSAHVYFGEWHKGLLEKAEKLERFTSSRVFLTDEKKAVTLQLKEDYLQANISTDGDVRMLQSTLPPRESKRGGHVSKTYYYAKAGRQETKPVMAFEMVPSVAGSNQFVLLFNGKPLGQTEVTVYGSPKSPKWQQIMRTNNRGTDHYRNTLGWYLSDKNQSQNRA